MTNSILGQLIHGFQFSRKVIPYLATFFLPLGSFGIIGVILHIGYGLLTLISNPQIVVRNRKQIFFALFFSALITLLSTWPLSSVISFIIIPPLLVILLIYLEAHLNENTIYEHLLAFELGLTILGISIILDFLSYANLIPSGLFQGASLHNWAASMLILGFPIAFHHISHRAKIHGSLLLFLLLTSLMLSLSWVGILGLIVSTVIFVGIKSKARALILIILVVITIMILFLQPDISLPLIRTFAFYDLHNILQTRIAIFVDSLSYVSHNPIFGVGIGNLKSLFELYPTTYYILNPYTHSHNLLIQTLLETGFVGLITLLTTIIWIFQNTIRNLKRNATFSSLCLASLSGFLMMQQFDISTTASSITLSVLLIYCIGNPRIIFPSQFFRVRTFIVFLTSAFILNLIVANSNNHTFNSDHIEITLLALSTPELINPDEWHSSFAGLKITPPRIENYMLVAHTCEIICVRLSEKTIEFDESGYWWGEVMTSKLPSGQHKISLYILHKNENKFMPQRQYHWSVISN